MTLYIVDKVNQMFEAKECLICGKLFKPLSGHMKACLTCRKELRKRMRYKYKAKNHAKVLLWKHNDYLNHKDKRLKTMKNYYQSTKIQRHEEGLQWKRKVLAHYSNGIPYCQCSNCPFPNVDLEFLTIDHIRNNGHYERKSLKRNGWAFYKWLIDNNYPEGYQVLCWNCNCAKGHNNGKCPHLEVK